MPDMTPRLETRFLEDQYTIDGGADTFTRAALLETNDNDPDLRRLLDHLGIGGTLTYGGGAAATFRITRVGVCRVCGKVRPAGYFVTCGASHCQETDYHDALEATTAPRRRAVR